jgi:glycosyltransferase involved in cell wall biosynthesis
LEVVGKVIGMVVPIDYLAIQSGMAQRIKADLAALSLCGYDVEVISPSSSSQLKDRTSLQFNTKTYSNFQRIKFLSEKTRLLLDMYLQMFNPSFNSLLHKSYRNYSLIFAHSPSSAVASHRIIRQQRPLIYVAHDYEYGRVREVTPNPIARQFIHRIESYACKRATKVLCVSRSDAKALEATYKIPEAKLALLPNSVDIDFISQTKSIYDRNIECKKLGIDPASFLLLFHGRMDYKANLDALEFILNELVPALGSMANNIKVMVAGARIPKWCYNTSSKIVSFHSDVPDMRRFLSVADAAIVPLCIGGGTRIKILEAFAAKVPVISTAKGVEGIDCDDGLHLLTAQRNITDFVDRVKRLAENGNLREKLIYNAYLLVSEKYGIPAAGRCLQKIVDQYEG